MQIIVPQHISTESESPEIGFRTLFQQAIQMTFMHLQCEVHTRRKCYYFYYPLVEYLVPRGEVKYSGNLWASGLWFLPLHSRLSICQASSHFWKPTDFRDVLPLSLQSRGKKWEPEHIYNPFAKQSLHSLDFLGSWLTNELTQSFLFCFVLFWFVFGATPVAYTRSQARGRLRAVAAYPTATATPNPSHICNLHHGSRQQWIVNSLSKARDWTHILMNIGWIYYHWATRVTPNGGLLTANFKYLEINNNPPEN